MEKTYIVSWMEKKTTSTGKEKLDCTLKAEGEEQVSNVTIWSDYPKFSEIAPGSTVTGTLTPAKDPRYGPTLYPPKPQTPSGGANRGGGGAYKAKMIEETMDKKATMIGRAQDAKSESIKIASTFSAAWQTAVAEYQEIRRVSIQNDASLEKLFSKWREFYWMNFDVSETQYPPFK